MYYLAEEFVRGDPANSTNPLRWDLVVLNLIGNANYNPTLPNVFKWDNTTKCFAGEIKACIDDLRAVGRSWEHAWSIVHSIASRLQYLGIQDAPRKRRADQGPWTGSVYLATKDLVGLTVMQEKWDKARSYINQISSLVDSKSLDKNQKPDYKLLESIYGFLCHLGMTYSIIFPYLKGFHLVLSQHLPKQTDEGWKLSDHKWIGYVEGLCLDGKIDDRAAARMIDPGEQLKAKQPPKQLSLLPRFYSCHQALEKSFATPSPPIWTERTSRLLFIVYGYADASQAGLGSTLWKDGVVS
mmetsp:Transcript_1680/g.2403  ORF Transcript_1680/g.2403 Transcript_1680/m.2403 type:complete len:297 (-) Transcript_1680:2566-3456(-)